MVRKSVCNDWFYSSLSPTLLILSPPYHGYMLAPRMGTATAKCGNYSGHTIDWVLQNSILLFSNLAADSHQISKTLWTSPKRKPRLRRLWWKRCAVSSGVRCFILWVFEKKFPKLPHSPPPGVLVAHDEGMVQPWKAMIMVFHSLMNPGFGAWCGQVALWLSSRAVASHGCVAVKNTMLVECSAKCLPGLR